MSEFETKVLEVLAQYAGSEDLAEWVSGTLFVECSEATAALLEDQFREAFCCGIIRSKAGKEYSFDFT
jgi:hypothetical protein